MLLISIVPLFSIFFQELSNDMPSEHSYKTIAKIYKAQWEECTTCKGDIFGAKFRAPLIGNPIETTGSVQWGAIPYLLISLYYHVQRPPLLENLPIWSAV